MKKYLSSQAAGIADGLQKSRNHGLIIRAGLGYYSILRVSCRVVRGNTMKGLPHIGLAGFLAA
ncbi:MAG: hypothetical protein WC299_16270, partial [Kiritimatiellia bacterium]